MDTTAVPIAAAESPEPATQLMAALASYVGTSDLSIDSIATPYRHPRTVVEFSLSGLPRRIVPRGLGEVFFNENTALTERGGCDGALVSVLRFDRTCAVIDAARGHAEYDDDNDAYLIGSAHLFPGVAPALAFATRCADDRRRIACRDLIRRAVELAAPLPPHVVAHVIREAAASIVGAGRIGWVHEVRLFLERPDLNIVR